MYKIKNNIITFDKSIFKNYKDYYLKKDDVIINFDSRFSVKLVSDGVYELYFRKKTADVFILNIIMLKKQITITKTKAEQYISDFNDFISRGIE